jgi:hypothetical protein
MGIESLAVVGDLEGEGLACFPHPQGERRPVPGMLACVLDGLQAAVIHR